MPLKRQGRKPIMTTRSLRNAGAGCNRFARTVHDTGRNRSPGPAPAGRAGPGSDSRELRGAVPEHRRAAAEGAARPARRLPTRRLLEMLRALLGVISQANDGLQADLTRFSNESSTLLAQAQHSIDAERRGRRHRDAQDHDGVRQLAAGPGRGEPQRAGGHARAAEPRAGRAGARAEPRADRPPHRAAQPPRPRFALSRELARARRTGTTLCLAVLDIDHFKRINDQFGHAVGDEALKHLADVLKPALRETDTLARFGGEEFVLVLPDTPLPAAEFTLNRLLRTLERAPLERRRHAGDRALQRRTRAMGAAGVGRAPHHARRPGDVRGQARRTRVRDGGRGRAPGLTAAPSGEQ